MPEMASSNHSLQIRDLSLNVKLGCTAEERMQAQEVRASIEFRFISPPRGMKTDKLEDTICYAKVCQSIKDFIEGREFALVEKLASDLICILREFSKDTATVALTVHKVLPPVENLLGGTVYRVGDFV
jgi:dihydroneopterin aldolase